MSKAETETNDVKLPELVITPDNMPEAVGNFDAIHKMLDDMLVEFKSLNINSKNLDIVVMAKKKVRTMRTTLQKVETIKVKELYDLPKSDFKLKFAGLYNKIAVMEDKCDSVLNAEEEKRVEKVNKRIDEYIAANIPDDIPDFDNNIIRQKFYYNKTQEEGGIYDDIDNQIETLKKNYMVYERALKKLEALHKKNKTLNINKYLAALQYHRFDGQVFDIVDEAESDNEAAETAETADKNSKPVIAVPEKKPDTLTWTVTFKATQKNQKLIKSFCKENNFILN